MTGIITTTVDAAGWGWSMLPAPVKAAVTTGIGAIASRIFRKGEERQQEPIPEDVKKLTILLGESEAARSTERIQFERHIRLWQLGCLAMAGGWMLSRYLTSSHDCR